MGPVILRKKFQGNIGIRKVFVTDNNWTSALFHSLLSNVQQLRIGTLVPFMICNPHSKCFLKTFTFNE